MTESEGGLRPLEVDMEALLDALMNGGDPDVAWFVDLDTGEVQIAIDGVERARLAPGSGRRRYVPLPHIAADRDFDIMARFAERVRSEDVRNELVAALNGKGAFGQFRAVVGRYPDLQTSWHEARRGAYLEMATQWLASLGYEPRYEPLSSAGAHEGRTATVAPQQSPRIGLLAVLLLGAPDGKTDLSDGRAHRVFHADSPDRAQAVFGAIARDLYRLYNVVDARPLDRTDRLVLENAELVRTGGRVDLSIRITDEVREAFRAR